MNVVVCIKRVASSASVIQIGPDGRKIDPTGVEFEINPYDEFAVEQALQTRDAAGGEVTVVTVGTSDAVKELRDCLARGADRAVLLKCGEELDAYATAAILAGFLKDRAPDVVFMGKQAIDQDNSQVPQRVATILGAGCVTEVKKLELSGDTFTAERDIEGGREVVTCRTPAVISTNKGLNEPRYANLKGIMQAKKKPLEEIAVDAVAPAITTVELRLPPARPAGRIIGEGPGAVAALIAALKNEAKVL